MRAVRILSAAAVCVLTSMAAAYAQEAPKESKGLFSDDEKEVLEYLSRGHRIPHFPAAWAQPEPKRDPRYQRELDRALELYRKGSTELRLAIATRLCDSKPVPEMWRASGPDDIEARHSLVGLGLGSEDPEFRKTCWEWLVTRADPGFAPILLKRVSSYGLEGCCQGMSDAERNRILPLIEQLYRRTGKATLCEPGPGDMGVPTVSGSIPALAIALLPATPEARDLVIRWLTADCWKMDRETLRAAWCAWSRMAENPFLSNAAFVRSLVDRWDIAESWLLLGQTDIGDWHPKFNSQQRAFTNTLRRQVFNPDERVRRSATRFVLRHSGWHFEQIMALFREETPNPLRRRTVVEARIVAEELTAGIHPGDAKVVMARLKQFIAVVDAPPPPALPAAAPTPPAPAPAEGKGVGPLFSENEKDVLDYLAKGYRIPDIPNVQRPVGAAIGDPRARGEVARALELYRKGSTALRLAIAKALCASQAAADFWNASGPDDVEARHYLFGLGFPVRQGDTEARADADREFRRTLWEWLLAEGDPGFAEGLLRRVDGGDGARHSPVYLSPSYAGMPEAERDRVLPLVERIYRRTGAVDLWKRGPSDKWGDEFSRSLPALAMDMLPQTVKARDLLLGWMTADCMKMPPDALVAAWEAWVRMGEDPDLFDAPFVAAAVERRDLAEAWVVSAERRDWRSDWHPKYERQAKAFRENTWRQVFNPDERVRRAAVRTALGDFVIVQYLGNQPPNPLRLDAVATAREIVADILTRVPENELYQREVWTKRLDAFIAAVDR